MSTTTHAKEVLITREIDAPRARVFAAWTDPAQLLRWYAPPGCRIEFASISVRPGGRYHSCIHTPDGHQCWCIGEYREVLAPERLVFTMEIANAQGQPISAIEAGMDPAWPSCTTVSVAFADNGSTTRLTLAQTVDEALAIRTGAQPSWLMMLDRLNELLQETERD